MGPVPLPTRIAGVDEVLCRVANDHPDAPVDWSGLRIAAAELLRRHDRLMAHLEDGGDPIWLVAEGVIAWWDDDLGGYDGTPNGGEGEPLAAAVLAALGPELASEAGRARPLVVATVAAGTEDIPEAVTVEILESLVLAGLGWGESPG